MAITRYGTQASVHYTRHMSLFHIDIISSSETITVLKITIVVPISRLLRDLLALRFLLATINLEKKNQISVSSQQHQLFQMLKVCVID